MNDRTYLKWTPKLPNEDALKRQSMRYIAMETWVRNYLVQMTSAQLTLKTAYSAYHQWCDLTRTPKVPIQAFNRALASRQAAEWPLVRRKRTANGVLYLNLTLRSWAETAPAPEEGLYQVASNSQ